MFRNQLPPRDGWKNCTGKLLVLKHRWRNRLVGMPAVPSSVELDQIDPIWGLGGLGSLVQAAKAALQAAPSFCPK